MEKSQKLNEKKFFCRLKTAIFKLEDYGNFLAESPATAIKYLLLLILLISVCTTIATTYDFTRIINKAFNYVENEIPDFSFKDGILKFDNYIEGYDEEYKFRLIIDTSDIENEKTSEYIKKIELTKNGALLLKDKLIVISDGQEITSKDYISLASELNVDTIKNKENLMELYNTSGRVTIISTFSVLSIIITFLTNLLETISDICIVAIIGWFIAKLCGMNLQPIGAVELSIYSLTLSIVLKTAYIITNTIIPSFNIEHFDIIYLLITYVYLIAALFIIKDDLTKQKQELEEIYKVEEEVRKELDEKEIVNDENQNEEANNSVNENDSANDKKENEEKEDSEKNLKEEPDGSEI